MTTLSSRFLSRAAALGLMLACILTLVRAGTVPPMDDTYIHLVYGRSLLAGQPGEYNPGVPSAGFTSPLWLAPSAMAALGGSWAGPMALMAISALAASLAVLLAGPGISSVLLLFGPFIFHATSGMETAMACLAVVLAWRLVDSRRPPDAVSGALLAAATLTRPELALLAIPLALAAGRPRISGLAALLAPSAIVGSAWIAWNLHAIGLPLPSTFYAKQVGSFTGRLGAGLPGLGWNLLLSVPLLLPAGAIGTVMLFRKRLPLALIPVLLGLAALLLQPNSYFQMRYHVPWLVALALAAGTFLQRRKWLPALVALMLVPGAMLFSSRRIRASRDVEAIDVQPALYLRETAAPGDVAACADVGAVRWLTDLRILDLDGLITPETVPVGRGAVRWSWLAPRTDYVVVFPRQYRGLLEDAGDELRHVAGFRSPDPVICGEDSVAVYEAI